MEIKTKDRNRYNSRGWIYSKMQEEPFKVFELTLRMSKIKKKPELP